MSLYEGVKAKSLKVQDQPVGVWQMCLTKFWEMFLKVSEVVMDRRKYNKLHFVQAFYSEPYVSLETKYSNYVKKEVSKSRNLFNSVIIDNYV